jgi:hypothetical protein
MYIAVGRLSGRQCLRKGAATPQGFLATQISTKKAAIVPAKSTASPV